MPIIDFEEIQEGVFQCTDDAKIRQFIQLKKMLIPMQPEHNYLYGLVENSGTIDLYIVQYTKRERVFVLTMIRDFLPRHVNLQRYAMPINVDATVFLNVLFQQVLILAYKVNYPHNIIPLICRDFVGIVQSKQPSRQTDSLPPICYN